MTQLVTTTRKTELTTARPFDTSLLAGQVAPSTMAMYGRDFRAYLSWAGDFETAMAPAALARWRQHLAEQTSMSPNTINRMLSAVKRLIKEAAEQGYTSHELAQQFDRISGVKVKALKERRRQTARTKLTPTQIRVICDAPDPATLAGLMHRALLHTLASSGLRISEAITLTPDQIELGEDDTGQLGYVVKVMGKNETEYSARPLSEEAYQHITAWLEARPVSSGWIFTGFNGNGSRQPRVDHITPQSAWQIVRRYSEASGYQNVKPHDFRRFVGTTLVRSRGLRAAQKALGHKRLETTAQHYDLSDLERGMTDDLY